MPVAYVPCERGRRYQGESKMTYGKLAMHGLRMLMPFTDKIAIRALAGGEDTTVHVGIVTPDGTHAERRFAFLRGSLGADRRERIGNERQGAAKEETD